MRTKTSILVSALAVIAALAVGYRWGSHLRAPNTKAPSAATSGTAERRVLYWRDPDGKPAYAATPIKTTAGKPYVPVHEDQEPDFPEAAAARQTAAKAATPGPRKLLYYRNPMGLADTSPVPKKDWMGMDYIAVYEGEDDGGSTVKVSLDKVQRSGVRTAPVEMRKLDRPVRAPGVAKPDERTLRVVSLRADGFIEKLYVNETGRHVKAGEPLFRVYSPQIVKVQVDYRSAITAQGRLPRDEEGALVRLRNLAIPETVIQQLKTSPNLATSIDWPSPVTGVVMKKPVMEGMMVKAGDELFRFADLSSIWVIADVAEQDIAQIMAGSAARISFRAFPGETFAGAVTFILHELEMATRTAKVRIEVKNSDYRIKHEMFADVEIHTGIGASNRLVVPASALIDSGHRQVVIVDRGEGRFEPRAVKVGARGDGFVEIIEGVKAGEMVVVTATFLIDAESNLKAALQAFTAEPPAKVEAKP
jgi:membrane fusion protein, copper/silver efflux system